MPAILERALLGATLAGALLAPSTGAAQSTVTTSTTVPAFSGFNFNFTPVTGLSQFNPALGTLTGIEFEVSNSYTAEVDLFLDVIDDSLPHEVDADVSFQISLGIPLASGGGSLFASGGGGATFTCSGGAFEGACTDSLSPIQDSGSYTEVEDATARLISNGQFDQFIGTGEIDFIDLDFLLFSDAVFFFFSDNIDESSAMPDATFTMGPADVTVTYTFVPIPVPAAAWLMMSALGLLASRQRRRG